MSLSAKQDPPDSERLDYLLEDAFRLWKDIPTRYLPEAVDDAIIQAGNFEATAGLVAKCWRERDGKEIHLGSGAVMDVDATRKYLDWLHNPNRDALAKP